MRRPQQHCEVYSIPYALDPNDLLYARQYKDHGTAAVLPPLREEEEAARRCQQQQQSVAVDPWLAPPPPLFSCAGDESPCCRQQQLAGSRLSVAPRPREEALTIEQRPHDHKEPPRRNCLVMWCSGGLQASWIIDVFCVLTVGSLLLLIELGWIPSVQTGFYCDDPSIAHRFTGDTISISMLLGVSIFVPLLAMWLVEAGCCFCQEVSRGAGVGGRARRGLRHAWVWYREYLLGLGLVLLAADVAKVIVGEPRPHFLDSCKPDVMFGPGGCKAAASPSGYIETFKCTNTDLSHYVVKDSTKSFPSGHAALSVYSAMFLIWFLQRRLPGVPSKAPSLYLRPWLQAVCATWAMACSFTRISDHRHHAHDVLAGTVLGVVIGLLAIRNFCGDFWPGYCAGRLHEESTSLGGSSGERGGAAVAPSGGEERRVENGHLAGGPGSRHQSVRRLLSSTSSYSGSIAAEESLREVTPT